jgi:uncharacterized membrane protein YkvA (DUF1232 family)
MTLKALAWIIGAALYCVCPLDGDFVPVVGWIDDAVVCWIAYRQVRKQMAANVIDV